MRAQLSRISFHAVAVLYTGGTVAQLLKLYLAFPWTEMPFVIDWVIVGLGSIGAAGLVGLRGLVAFRGRWERVVHWVIVLHLVSSVLLHLLTLIKGDHDLYAAFPYGYSYFAVTYFAFFAWRSWTVKFRSRDREPE